MVGSVHQEKKTSASPGEMLLCAHQNHNVLWRDCGVQLSV